MTNTKFRKRALLSSVAMLLVALVALGSATFAWFTANPNANASGLQMKTTASAGLVVRTDTDTEWSHSAHLAYNKPSFNALPVSQEQSDPDKFWTVGADNSSNYGAKSGESMTAATSMGYNGTESIYKEKIYCRLSDGSDANANSGKKVQIKGITITPSNNTDASMASAMRVAIADKNGNLLGTWATAITGANGTKTTTGGTAGSFGRTEGGETVAGLAVAQTSGMTLDTGLVGLSAASDSDSNYITVYVYLDGQDSLCYSDKVGLVNSAGILSSVQVDLVLV